jgi:hypothetical protein
MNMLNTLRMTALVSLPRRWHGQADHSNLAAADVTDEAAYNALLKK